MASFMVSHRAAACCVPGRERAIHLAERRVLAATSGMSLMRVSPNHSPKSPLFMWGMFSVANAVSFPRLIVTAMAGIVIATGAMQQSLLRCANVFRFARPGLERGCLKRTAEGEA